MSDPYIGEIRMFGGNFPPNGWAFCDGALLPISGNDALFTLIGTTYGGDGQETFGLPDLRGRVPLHMGQGPGISQNYVIGESAGVESVTLSTQQIPVHTHTARASSTGQVITPANNVMATATSSQAGVRVYSTNAPDTNLHPSTITPAGGSQPHENTQPSLGINFIISLFGIFPSQN